MITQELAKFIVSLKFEDIPATAIEKAKICFLDFLGVSLRGASVNSSQIAQKLMSAEMDISSKSGKSTIIGNGKGPCMDAAFINAISAHSLDLDDGHRLAQLHPGCTVIPATLALSEHLNKRGDDFLTSLIVGYEVAIVLGKLVNPQHRNQGFHSTGTIGTFAATAAASKILNLNEEEIINAMGLAGTQSAGLLESDHAGTMGKHLHAGKASQSGILSALLSKNGFTGPSTIFEGKEGFLKAMVGVDLEEDNRVKSSLYSDIGQFHITDVYLKKYPICRHLHSTIDSARSIIHELGLTNLEIDMVDKITVKTYKTAAEHDNYNPQTTEAVRQSLPVSLSIALLYGDITLDDIGEEFKITPQIQEILDKINIELDENMDSLQPDKRPSKVIINFKDSNFFKEFNKPQQIEKTTLLPYGEGENPFKKRELFEKFSSLNPEFNLQKLTRLEEILLKMEFFEIRNMMGYMQ